MFNKNIISCIFSGFFGAVFTALIFCFLLPTMSEGKVSNPLIFTPSEKNTSIEQIAKPTSEQMSIVDIAKKMEPAIVAITTTQKSGGFFGGTVQGSGSGIIFKTDGYIATNNHVVEGASEIKVIMSSGEEYVAKLIGTDAKTDLAVIKIDHNNLQFAEFGQSSDLEVGEVAIAFGSPLGLDLSGSVTVGFISALNRTLEVEGRELTLIQTDAAINQGNSGGALVNGYGQVVGINSVKIQGAEGLGFAIPIDNAKPIFEDLMANGKVTGRPLIGFTPLREISKSMSDFYDIPMGIYVDEVEPFSGAENGGLKRRDVIYRINDEECLTMSSLQKIKDKHSAGDTITMDVKRKNDNDKWEDVHLSIVLGEEK